MTMQKSSANLTDISFAEALGERYLSYALSTIMSRSLPDVRDGLKPVHRRLLYAMWQLKLDPKSGFKKCARVVGDVIGKYHPHGDVAVYDAMVRLAQEFSVRYPLVEGQGNFGSIDGDNAAAMRYTEARLTKAALALLEGLEEDTVDFMPTYDGEDKEPVLLPANFPNLLANGAEGIAVGMATSIPPHNVGDICDALLHLIDEPKCEVAALVERVQGPDFPTGGVIIEDRATLVQAYTSGKGAIRVRARWDKQELTHGLYQIVITEIPYQVTKSRLVEKIAELFKDKKLPLLGNIRDESAEDLRLVLEPKNRTVDPEVLMASLFKLTELENRFNMNLNVLTSAGVPKVCDLKFILQEFIDHRLVVLERASRYRLQKIEHRLEVLDGLLIAYLNIDEVIRIIRFEDNPKQELMATFSLSEVQVEAILNMRLRSLHKLEEIEIRREHDELMKEKKKLEALLASRAKRVKAVRRQIEGIQKEFGQETELGKRRTSFERAAEITVDLDQAFIEKEPITVSCSSMGWIRALKGHTADPDDMKFKEGDSGRFLLRCQTTDKLLVFARSGKFFTLAADKLPRGKGFGEPLRLMCGMEQSDDIVSMLVYRPGQKLLLASTAGKGFIVDADSVVAQTKSGKQVLSLPEKAVALCCRPVPTGDNAADHVAVIGSNRKFLVFALEDIPEMKRGQGVVLQKYKGGKLSDVKMFKAADGLSWKSGERTRTESDTRPWLGKRGQVGKLPPTGFPRSNTFGE